MVRRYTEPMNANQYTLLHKMLCHQIPNASEGTTFKVISDLTEDDQVEGVRRQILRKSALDNGDVRAMRTTLPRHCDRTRRNIHREQMPAAVCQPFGEH